MKKQILCIVILIFVNSSIINGSIPRTISYQGVVTDSKGNPKEDGEYKFVFTIYNDSVSGDSIWSEKKEIETKQGLFSTELGSDNTLALPFDTTYWLGINVEGKAFTKRTKLTGAPYSFRADTAEVAKKADTAEIAKGLVDSFYTRDQLREPGKAEVHADNIENAPWLDSIPSRLIVTQHNEIKDSTSYLENGGSAYNTFDYDAIILGDNSSNNHTQAGLYFKSRMHGSSTTIATRLIQDAKSFKIFNGSGDIPLAMSIESGNVSFPNNIIIDGNNVWHSGNLNPDYFVQGETVRCSYNYSDKNPLDSNHISAFYAIQENDPSNPPFNAYGIHISSASADGYGLDIIGRGNQNEIYWSGLDKYKRSPWRKIWHSGNLDTSKYSLKTDFNSDYFVQGIGSNRSVLFENQYRMDDNRYSTFFHMTNTDPNTPSTSTVYGFRAVHSSSTDNTFEICGRPVDGELYFGGLQGDERQPWHEIWHSGVFPQPETDFSDIRFKTDIDSIKDPLKKVNSLKGISFNWKESEFPDRNFPEGRQIGVIAQEVEKILPEVVRTDKDGYKSVAYSKLSALLIEAVKEQQSIIDSLKQNLEITRKELEKNNTELKNISNRLAEIEKSINSK